MQIMSSEHRIFGHCEQRVGLDCWIIQKTEQKDEKELLV